MMDLRTIQSQSRRAARQSAAEGRGPLIVEPSDLPSLDDHLSRIPFLGYRTPAGFRALDLTKNRVWNRAYPYRELFVDISGFGVESEPALTFRGLTQAIRTLVEKHGALALSFSEMGQFQGHIRVMVPTKHRSAK